MLPPGMTSVFRVILIPPLVPSLELVGVVLYGGLTSGPGSWYMPVLFEGWFFFLGMVAWGGADLCCLTVTVVVQRWYPSITVGFFYALLVGVSTSALVSWHGWMVDRLEPDMKVLFVATLPMFATAFLSFWLLTGKSSHHLPWLSPVALPAIASIACLSASVCLLIYMLRDIETTAHQYYWQHQPELAEVIDGEPVIENLLFQWVDETPTAASTEDRA